MRISDWSSDVCSSDLRPTDAKIGAGCCDQSVRLRQDQPFRHRGQRLREIWRTSVALIDGEDRKEFEERNAAGRCARLDLGPVLLFPGGDASRVDTTDSALAAADRSAQHDRLPQSQDGRGRETAGERTTAGRGTE